VLINALIRKLELMVSLWNEKWREEGWGVTSADYHKNIILLMTIRTVVR